MSNHQLLPLAILHVLLAESIAHAQNTWIVSYCAAHPGVQFATLQEAVIAASPGDTILLVVSNSCSIGGYFNGARIDKPLTIIGVYPGSPIPPGPSNNPNGVSMVTRLEITGIPAGSRVVLSNIYMFAQLPGGNLLPTGLHAWDCAGEIVLEDVAFNSNGFQQALFRFERCADVSIRETVFYAGAEAMTFIDSNAVISRSGLYCLGRSILGWPYTNPPYSAPYPPNTIHVENSHVVLWDTDVRGCGGFTTPTYIPGTYGAWVQSGTLETGPAAWLIGGATPNWHPPLEPYAPGLHLEPGGQAFADYRSYVHRVSNLPSRTIHTVSTPALIQDQPYTVRTFGPQNGFALLAVGSAMMTPMPLGFGDLGILQSTIQFIAAAGLDSQYGEHEFSLFCPRIVPDRHVFAFQAAVLSPAGEISLTLPSQCTVAWAFGRVQ